MSNKRKIKNPYTDDYHKVSFSGNEGVDMSRSELKSLSKAFEEDEFQGLLSDYVKEVSDPKGREEQFQYLDQLDEQGEVPPGMMLVRPTEGFCIKTTIYSYGSNRTTRLPKKCFVNMCRSDVIEKASEKGGKGWWSMPHVVSAGRPDQDKKGSVCTTFDALFHPATIDECGNNPIFQEMCVNVALETITKHHKNSGDTVSKDWKLLKNMKVKGQKPGYQLIPDKDARENKDLRKESSIQKQIREMKEQHTREQGGNPDDKETPLIEEMDSKEFATEVEQGLVEPKYTLMESNTFDMADSFYDPSGIIKFKRPTGLSVEVWLPRVSKMSQIDLDISPQKMTLDVPELYYLNRKLPYECVEESVKAKWDKAKKVLRINIGVKPKPQEKMELPFTKVEYDGVDEDDIDDADNQASKSDQNNHPSNTNSTQQAKQLEFQQNGFIDVIDSKAFDENDINLDSSNDKSKLTNADDIDEVESVDDSTINKGKKNDPFLGLMPPLKLFRYDQVCTPEVVVRQSDTHVFLMFEAKGIETPMIPDFNNYYYLIFDTYVMTIFYSLKTDKFYSANYQFRLSDYKVNKFMFKLSSKIDVLNSTVKILKDWYIFELLKVDPGNWKGVGKKLDLFNTYIKAYNPHTPEMIVKEDIPYRDMNGYFKNEKIDLKKIEEDKKRIKKLEEDAKKMEGEDIRYIKSEPLTKEVEDEYKDMPELINEDSDVLMLANTSYDKKKNEVKFFANQKDQLSDMDIGLKQVESKKLYGYNEEMINFINTADSKIGNKEVHDQFRKLSEIFFVNNDLPKFGLEKQKTVIDVRTNFLDEIDIEA